MSLECKTLTIEFIRVPKKVKDLFVISRWDSQGDGDTGGYDSTRPDSVNTETSG